MTLKNLIPFRKKFIQWFGGSHIPSAGSNRYLVSFFGNSSVVWSKYLPQTQNNILLIEKFNKLAEVSAPIYKFADGSTQVTIDTFVKSGNDLNLAIETDSVKKQIDRFWNDYSALLMIQKKLMENVYIHFLEYKNYLTEQNERVIKLLPSQYTYIVPTQAKDINYLTQRVAKYRVEIDSNHIINEIDAENVLHIKGINPKADQNNYLYGISKLVSNGFNIDCLTYGYGAKATLYKNGPKGFLTGKQIPNDFGATNLDSDETALQMQDRFSTRYGLQEDQYQWLVTTRPMDVTLTSFNAAQLQINENNRTDFEKICASMNINPLAVSSTYNSTFDNVQAAITHFYTGAFKQEIDYIIKLISEKIQTWYPNYVLKPNYTQIPEIVEALKKGDKELLELTEKGLYTRNEYYTMIGERTVDNPEFDEFYYFDKGWKPVKTEQNERQETRNNTETSGAEEENSGIS